jgi:Skp family chaperone for outer membrane proteins
MFMTKSFCTFFLTATLLVLTAGAAHAQGRIATVDLVKVFDKYYMTKEAKQAIVETEKDLKNELKTMDEAHQKLLATCKKLVEESNDQGVSDEERQKRKKALEPKLKEFKDSETALKETLARSEADLKQKTGRMMEKVVTDIKKAVESKAKAGGFAYVIDSSARSLSQTEVMLFNSGENDLTTSVLDQLNAAAPVDSGKK